MSYFIGVNREELKDLIDELSVIYEATDKLALDGELDKGIDFKFYNDKPTEIRVDLSK